MSINTKMTAIADKVRVLHGTDGKLGLDDMAEMVDNANSSIDEQAEMIAQLSAKLEGKFIPENALLEVKEVTPSAEGQVVTPDSDKFALSKVIVAGDEDLIAANIKRNVEIFGVKGTYTGESATASAKTTAELEINGDSYTVNGIPQSGHYHRHHDLNTNIELSYTGSGSFLHWLGANSKIIGDGAKTATYAFTAKGTAVPVVVDESIATQNPPRAYIEFMSEYSQVMGAGEWGNADNPEHHRLPKIPMKIGYNSIGWTLDGQNVCTVQDIINSIDGSFAYKEIKGLYEKITIPLTVTVGNNIDDTVITFDGERASRTIISKHSTGYEDYIVAYWSWDKEGLRPIGYNATNYGIYASHDTTVYIQYVPNGTAVERLSALAITGAYPAGDSDDFAVVVSCVRDIVSGDTVIVHGILYAFGNDVDADTAEETMVLGSPVVSVQSGTTTSKRSSFTLNTRPSTTNMVVWVRGYATLEGSDGVVKTIYSEVYSTTYDELIARDREAGIIE